MEVQYLDFNNIENIKKVMEQNDRIKPFLESEESFETLIGNSNVYYISESDQIVAYLVLVEGYIIADVFMTYPSENSEAIQILIDHVQGKYDELHYNFDANSIITKHQLEEKHFSQDSENQDYYIWES